MECDPFLLVMADRYYIYMAIDQPIIVHTVWCVPPPPPPSQNAEVFEYYLEHASQPPSEEDRISEKRVMAEVMED